MTETVAPQPGCPLCQPSAEDCLWQEPRLRIIHVHDEAGQPAYFRVIWQAHVSEMSDLSEDDRQHLWQVLTVVERGVRDFLAPVKVNLASLGNQVPHLHWHVIGRWHDDPQFPGSVWSPAQRPADSGPQQENARRVAAALPAFRAWLADQLTARQR
ncbi:MAG: HIT family protein [Lautropia sp.]|nr:HIT family protein [Lautropia sp.]